MSESLESFKSYIGKSERGADVVTASAMLKIAAALGLKNPASARGDPIPPGWYGAFFPPSHGPSQMRADGQPSGGGIAPPIPLPRRRLGGVRMSFHEPLKIGDEITRVTSPFSSRRSTMPVKLLTVTIIFSPMSLNGIPPA